jgi:Zn/Cd-binding protein ZinT
MLLKVFKYSKKGVKLIFNALLKNMAMIRFVYYSDLFLILT